MRDTTFFAAEVIQGRILLCSANLSKYILFKGKNNSIMKRFQGNMVSVTTKVRTALCLLYKEDMLLVVL